MKTEELKKTVFEALGEVSMCWSETPNGVFESSRAEEIGNRLLKAIEEYASISTTPSLPSDEDIALKAGKRLLKLTVHDPVQRELTETEKTVSASGYIAGSKDMRSIASARIAEMEEENKRLKQLLNQHSEFRAECVALNDPAITEIDDKIFPF